MTLFQETGIRFPEHWYCTYEVCADNGYGYKLGEYEQANIEVIKSEMQEVISNKTSREAHHNAMIEAVNNNFETEPNDEEWIECLVEHLNEVNYVCKGDFD